MTCVIGFVSKDGTGYMAADTRAVCNGRSVRTEKIRKIGGHLVGFAGDWRIIQVLMCELGDVFPGIGCNESALISHVVPLVRETARSLGLTEGDVDLLILSPSGMFSIVAGCVNAIAVEEPEAIGSGADYALGAFVANRLYTPARCLELAVEIACMFDSTVGEPIQLEKLEGVGK